jgi:CubicO group peptidase (beta-lactamase class C family)
MAIRQGDVPPREFCRQPASAINLVLRRHIWLALLIAPVLFARAATWPGETWLTAAPIEVGLSPAKLDAARTYALTGNGSGYVIRNGKLVMTWGDPRQVFDLKSSTKAIGVTALGLALQDGKVKLDDPAKKFHPAFGTPPDANARTGWPDKITLRMLANQTAGFEKPGGYQPLVFQPGTQWHYSDGGPNWLAECLTLAYGRDLSELMFERVFTPLGIKPSDLRWRSNSYRPHQINGLARREFGAGISANVEAMSRIGYLYLRGGRWKDEQILPRDFVAAAGRTGPELAGLPVLDPKTYGSASAHYGLLWWNNNDAKLAGVPRDTFWSWGLYDSLIVVLPSLDLVVARAGQSWARDPNGDHYDVLKPFLQPLCAAVQTE